LVWRDVKMGFVRVSMLVPPGHAAEEISRIQKDLLVFHASQPGFVDGYYMEAADESGVVGRVTIWESEEHAHRAASHDHVMAHRASLLRLAGEPLAAQGFRASRVGQT
jgi:heme-degrading monooxygenase HmoA